MKPLLSVLGGETLSVPPVWLMRQAGRYLPEYRKIRARAGGFLNLCFNPQMAAEVTLQPVRRFGLDAAILFSDILVVPYALGQDLKFEEGEGPRLDPVRSVRALDRLSLDRIQDKLSPVYETVRLVKTGLSQDAALIGFAGAPWTVATYMVEGQGSRDFAEAKGWAWRDPAGFSRLLDLLVQATADYLCAQVDAGAEVLQIFDTWAGALPEDLFDRCVIEPTRALVQKVRQRHPHIPVIGFPKGAGVQAMRYAEQTGVTALGLDPAVPLSWARDTLQKRWPVQGNLDPVLLLTGGEAMDRGVDHILDTLGHGPFVFNLGHGILPPTPPEHVERLVRRVRARAGSS
ncbi:MAG: uroporphyrinogen decarboxylase [Pseudomonadota bacterium]|nr:uroporphyrinogen decarboxylase [Pseudomonadota bacterium]